LELCDLCESSVARVSSCTAGRAPAEPEDTIPTERSDREEPKTGKERSDTDNAKEVALCCLSEDAACGELTWDAKRLGVLPPIGPPKPKPAIVAPCAAALPTKPPLPRSKKRTALCRRSSPCHGADEAPPASWFSCSTRSSAGSELEWPTRICPDRSDNVDANERLPSDRCDDDWECCPRERCEEVCVL